MPGRPARGHGRPIFEGHQRLVANPFLAIIGLLAWAISLRPVIKTRRLELFIPVAASVLLVYFLFQYHCLDCGRTGRLSRWRDHACDAVQVRAGAGHPGRIRVLNPSRQTILWFYLLASLGVVGYILGG